MKRFALSVLILVSAAALFAAPAPEAIDGEEGLSDDLIPAYGRDENSTPIEIAGTIEFVDEHPVLVADGKTYLIGTPRAMMYADDVSEGTAVVIRGRLVSDPSNEIVDIDVDGHILIEEAEVDGEVFEFDRFAMGPGRPAFDDRGPNGDNPVRGGRRGRMPRGRW